MSAGKVYKIKALKELSKPTSFQEVGYGIEVYPDNRREEAIFVDLRLSRTAWAKNRGLYPNDKPLEHLIKRGLKKLKENFNYYWSHAIKIDTRGTEIWVKEDDFCERITLDENTKEIIKEFLDGKEIEYEEETGSFNPEI